MGRIKTCKQNNVTWTWAAKKNVFITYPKAYAKETPFMDLLLNSSYKTHLISYM